ncbi:type II toxin-antitoxin system VapC family toxin [Humibacter ginsenosidimutans]|uniref:Ribonuclease VapC n=1 Tax=Humibacter ginsenosidimutans TaxID=2599293 RepID=A0A5B8M6B9_9MICO|nr:type II toxin-antitoxin system VapC family toxin [Humibacter ginsenosidimutans]QDZ16308.1 type II toxin-antitoxin system VapC family toxin [Humibacter ginsenosidimutans]
MIAYFDTSAIVPLIVPEPATELCRRVALGAERAVSCRISYVETTAALAQAERHGRMTQAQLQEAVKAFQAAWERFDVVELDEPLCRDAAQDALAHRLRGYDAVHCAAALAIAAADVVAVSGDRALLAAWADRGLATVDIGRV